ncbi:MAG TPA: nicotinic acid mononucleotide adenylyltransferase, partial [Rhodospirillaceae bacterium]|nr:nicotinic acid mononucleotide adenylyltransferase [Rhodospirillaceae bacterium]
MPNGPASGELKRFWPQGPASETEMSQSCRIPFPGRRVGLLGGSFNPAHRGHRLISVEAMKRLNLDAVWWLVSPQNPLKPSKGMEKLEKRFDSAIEVAAHPRIWVNNLESEMGTQYSVDTIAKIQQRFSDRRFVWLIGADNLKQMPDWRRWEKIFNSIPVAVFTRPSYSHRALGGLAAERFRKARLKERQSSLLADT